MAVLGVDLGTAARTVNAAGKYVLPGAIDVHTRFEMPFMGTFTADDFRTGTAAAAAGGITTVVDWAIQEPGESLFTTLEKWDTKAAGKTIIDYSFHLVLTDLSRHALDEIQDVCISPRRRRCRRSARRARGAWPDFEGAKFVCSPPLRRRENTPHLWNGLREENLQEISSDHCAFNWRVQKELGRDSFANIPNGLAGIETMIPVVFSEGVRGGHLSLNQFARLTSTNSARLFGLYPEKGAIAVGSDADLVVFDPDRKVTVTRDLLHQNVDHTPYEGFAVTGWPAVTISRGEVVFEDGMVVGRPGRGRFVKRKATTSV